MIRDQVRVVFVLVFMMNLRNEKMDPQIRGWLSPQMHFATAGEVGMQELK